MTSDDIAVIGPRTESPIEDRLPQFSPFSSFQSTRIIDFALQYLDQTDISPSNIIILDERSYQDSTCLLLSEKGRTDDVQAFVQTRSDFKSAVVTLTTIETGCGDYESQLSTSYPDSMESSGYRCVIVIKVMMRRHHLFWSWALSQRLETKSRGRHSSKPQSVFFPRLRFDSKGMKYKAKSIRTCRHKTAARSKILRQEAEIYIEKVNTTKWITQRSSPLPPAP